MFLSGCAQGPSGLAAPGLTFSHLKPIPINVGSLRTQQAGEGASEAFVISPYETFEKYFRARFVPNGFAGALSATVEEASIAHSYQGAKSNVARYLNVAGMDVYDMRLRIRLEHLGMDSQPLYGTRLNARHILRVSEHASIQERERAQLHALEEMFRDLDGQMLRIVLADMNLRG